MFVAAAIDDSTRSNAGIGFDDYAVRIAILQVGDRNT
jgi:hypothetical protein